MVVGNVKSSWYPIGRWEEITRVSTPDVPAEIDTVVHHGFQTATTDDERLTQSLSLQYQFANGVTWYNWVRNYQVLVNSLAGVIQESQDSYTADYSVDVSAKCPAKEDVDSIILYQWVIASADGSDKLYTPDLVCDYGIYGAVSNRICCESTGC